MDKDENQPIQRNTNVTDTLSSEAEVNASQMPDNMVETGSLGGNTGLINDRLNQSKGNSRYHVLLDGGSGFAVSSANRHEDYTVTVKQEVQEPDIADVKEETCGNSADFLLYDERVTTNSFPVKEHDLECKIMVKNEMKLPQIDMNIDHITIGNAADIGSDDVPVPLAKTPIVGNQTIYVDGQTEESKIKEKPFECGICGFASYQNNALATHMDIHITTTATTEVGEKEFKCEICEYTSTKETCLTNHKKKHSVEKPETCDVGGYAGNRNNVLTTNLRTTDGDDKLYKCDVCGYACSKIGHLNQHKKIHSNEKPYKCDVCEYASSRKPNLANHKRIHTGERPFKCGVCGNAFSIKSDLTRHMRRHTDNKPYKCDVCGLQFNKKCQLNDHKIIHPVVKRFECDVCGYKCDHKNNFKNHQLTHTGEKPFKCDICGFETSRISHLVQHKKRHTGVKPHKCEVCDYACYLKSDLIQHTRIHTGETPYNCGICGFQCKRQGGLIRHMKKRHTSA